MQVATDIYISRSKVGEIFQGMQNSPFKIILDLRESRKGSLSLGKNYLIS